jgi:hypothetical protein
MAYLPLSTANLPDPAIDPAQGSSPADYFDIDTYAGTSATHERSNFTFQPDWLWFKRRSGADNHIVNDVIRGAGKDLKTNETGAEGTATTSLLSFDADGFTLGTGGDLNQSGQTFVAWAWKAGTSVSGSTTGSGTSQSYTGSVSPISGFGIIGYAGNGTAGHSIPHHLDSAPEVVIVKRRTGADNWAVTTPDVNRLYLNGTNTASSINYNWADQDGSVVTLNGTDAFMNATSNTYIMYCFHSVEGFSKFSSYEGTNNADGPFIYLGFRPKFFLLKNVDSALQWIIFDGERDPYNVVGKRIFPNLSNAESAVPSNSAMDFLSNGVKIRVAGGYDINDTGTYIYMAFAENPFKYSNAR